ncbi:MAG: hypothetical protein IT320_18630 [Anaerolineae bacterium]|nr:hypothetical protein [Anaerolineae bacterium]
MLSLPFGRPRTQFLTLGKVGKAFFSPLFRVPYPTLRAHMHVIGRSGRGKSKALEKIVCQHIANGIGYGLVDQRSHSQLINIHRLLRGSILRWGENKKPLQQRCFKDRTLL